MTDTQGLDPLGSLQAAAHAAPGLDPQTTVGIAKSSASPAEAVMKAQATFHFGNTIQAYDTLSSMSHSAQASAWSGLTGAEQSSLRSVGYRPPPLDAQSHIGAGGPHGGFWSDLVGGVKAVGRVVWTDDPLVHGAARGVNDVSGALGAGLRFSQHVVRAAHEVGDMGVAAVEGPSRQLAAEQHGGVNGSDFLASFRDIFSPSAWAAAWRETTDGNRFLQPAIHRELIDRYGSQQVNLAIQVSAAGAQSVVQNAPQAQRQSLVQLFQSPKFNDLVTQVGNAKVSLGRSVVGSQFLNQHPAAARAISGGIDAAYDWFADPAMAAGKLNKAETIARFAMREADVTAHLAGDASHADAVLASKPVQRMVNYVGSHYLEKGDYAGLAKFDPRFDSIAEQLQREGVDSSAKFADWYSGQAGMQAMMTGKAARIADGVVLVPHLTPMGWAAAGVKDILSKGLDRVADLGQASKVALGDGAVTNTDRQIADMAQLMRAGDLASAPGKIKRLGDAINVARIVRSMTTLAPTAHAIDIADGKADVANFRRFVQGFLPAARVDDITNLFIHGDEGQRWNLVQAARQQMFHAAGLYNTPEGKKLADGMLDQYHNVERQTRYSVHDIDSVLDDHGLPQHMALLDGQTAGKVHLPYMSELRAAMREDTTLGTLGIHPLQVGERVTRLWRRLVLLRPGFAVRFALDENLGRLLRSGWKGLIGSYLANGTAQIVGDDEIERRIGAQIAKGQLATGDTEGIAAERAALKALATKPLVPYHAEERALRAIAQHVPAGVAQHVDSPAKFAGAALGSMTRRWARTAEKGGLKALGLSDYIDAATHLYTHQPVKEAFEKTLSAMHGAPPDVIWSPTAHVENVRNGVTGEVARFKRAGPFSEAAPADAFYRYKWQYALEGIAHSQLGRAVLGAIDESPATQERAVLRVLQDPEFASQKARFARASRSQRGVVGVDLSQAQADRDWARTVVRHVNAHVRAGDPGTGDVLHELTAQMIDGHAPDMDTIDQIVNDRQRIPALVYGPDLLPVTRSDAPFLDRAMETVVGRPANWLTRQPHFVQMYAEALRELGPLAKRLNPADSEKLLSDMAFQRATARITPFIHNPKLRTQFEQRHRQLFPFLFAQRQFLQRWGRTFAESPDAIRRIQLTMNGLRTSGFLHRDQNGQDYFFYPGSQYVSGLIMSSLNRLGIHVSQPLVTPFTGQLQYLMPGLSNPLTPSVGPFASVSMKELAKLIPSLNGLTQKVLGQGASTPVWQDFTPTIFNRALDAVGIGDAGAQLASTTMQAIKELDATGHGLSTDATPAQVEQYASRVTNWAHSLLYIRAALGFVLPATPTADIDQLGLSSRLRTLMAELPYGQAVTEFIREDPDATAYTVSESQNTVPGNTPATAASLQWMNAHLDFVRAHPQAAAWFIPRSTAAFDPAAYREQIALGLRQTKDAPTFLSDVVMARASGAYYTTLDRYNAAYDATRSTAQHQNLVNWWDNWKASFFTRNPLFAEYVQSNAGAIRRQEVIRDAQSALSDGSVPAGPQRDEMSNVLGRYEQFENDYLSQQGFYSTSTTRAKATLKTDAVNWGNAYATAHPEIADFWNTVIRPQVDSAK